MVYTTAGGAVEALREISLGVGAGEFAALVGPSGCGRPPLLGTIAGLRPATGGVVRVAGGPVVSPLHAVGMVFQAPVLLKWRRVLDNVLLPAELAGLDSRRHEPRARE